MGVHEGDRNDCVFKVEVECTYLPREAVLLNSIPPSQLLSTNKPGHGLRVAFLASLETEQVNE